MELRIALQEEAQPALKIDPTTVDLVQLGAMEVIRGITTDIINENAAAQSKSLEDLLQVKVSDEPQTPSHKALFDQLITLDLVKS